MQVSKGQGRLWCVQFSVCLPPISQSIPRLLYVWFPQVLTPALQPMIPTFVFGWPSGDESGDYLAIDLGTLARNMARTLIDVM